MIVILLNAKRINQSKQYELSFKNRMKNIRRTC